MGSLWDGCFFGAAAAKPRSLRWHQWLPTNIFAARNPQAQRHVPAAADEVRQPAQQDRDSEEQQVYAPHGCGMVERTEA